MNKEITIFQLIELIETENVPKKIEYEGNIYTYSKNEREYKYFDKLDGDYGSFKYLSEIVDCFDSRDLSFKATILDEENDEFEDIGELEGIYCTTTEEDSLGLLKSKFNHNIYSISDRIDSLIKNQNKLITDIERLKNNE